MTPMISVILPVFNGGAYLEPMLESLLAQTYGDFEIVCVDDGSTDGSSAVLARFAGRDARVRVWRQENAGIIAARNAAISRARGAFLALQDQDDLSEPRRFEAQIAAFACDLELVLCGTQATQIDGKGRQLHATHLPTQHEDLIRRFPVENPFCHCSVMMRRSVLDKLGRAYIYPEVDDYELLFQVARLGRATNLSERLYRYRVHRNQYSSRYHGRMLLARAALQRDVICPELGVPYRPVCLSFAMLDEVVFRAHQAGDRRKAMEAARAQLKQFWWHWRPYSWLVRICIGERFYRGSQRVVERILPA